MRKKVIAGNWKMNNDIGETQNLISGLINGINRDELNCEVIICPPYTSLSESRNLISETYLKLGAQNLYFEENGAFTGEISAKMLKSVGCEYVILGHSERRTIFNESDELINKKVKKALSSGLKVIFCIGETLNEREMAITYDVIERQLIEGLKGLEPSDLTSVIIAYEPVWAIGTGKNATPGEAQEVHSFIRSLIRKNFSPANAEGIIIQYGGSVKPENAAEILTQADIDGALVGGACLKSESFLCIIKSA